MPPDNIAAIKQPPVDKEEVELLLDEDQRERVGEAIEDRFPTRVEACVAKNGEASAVRNGAEKGVKPRILVGGYGLHACGAVKVSNGRQGHAEAWLQTRSKGHVR